MHLSDFVLLVVGTLAAIAAGLAVLASNYGIARILFWIAALSFGSMGVVWSATSEDYSLSTQMIVSAIIGAIAAAGLTWALWETRGKERAGPPRSESTSQAPMAAQAQGGAGGSGEIFGNNGTIRAGKGGNVGAGGAGRGGDGGGGIIHGDGGTIIGGEGGSVDGVNIWFPPSQSGFIQFLESQGQTPEFNVQYPGAGGATVGWLERQQIVAKIREDYFKKAKQEGKIKSSKIEDVPLEYINKKLKEEGQPWRARIEKKYWYLYYIP
jgi:hypothetical protein